MSAFPADYIFVLWVGNDDDNNKSEGGLQEIRILSFYDEDEEEASLSSYCAWMTMVGRLNGRHRMDKSDSGGLIKMRQKRYRLLGI